MKQACPGFLSCIDTSEDVPGYLHELAVDFGIELDTRVDQAGEQRQ